MKQQKQLNFVASSSLPTLFGAFSVFAFSDGSNEEHLALVKGSVSDCENVLVRLHSQCLTGDTLGSLKCDCRQQFEEALKLIDCEGKGVLVYLRQEGRGIGLANKIKAYSLQEQGLDTVEANKQLGFEKDLRSYEAAAEILKHLRVKSVRLLTNNPEKIIGLNGSGISVVERVPLSITPNEHNFKYLETKKTKLNHLLE
ncbi:GTP cyclohydrolase II [Candidatus Micrarchaeota archaeon]|nr:GTP cyclohydrolase II [Candidatus Micrarchaeota archaeon]